MIAFLYTKKKLLLNGLNITVFSLLDVNIVNSLLNDSDITITLTAVAIKIHNALLLNLIQPEIEKIL